MSETVLPFVAFIALGSNLGDRLANLGGGRRALDATTGVRVEAASPVYETEPVGGPQGQGLYLNAVVRVATSLSPRNLLDRCLEIEARYGRTRGERWEARTLDLDLLLFDTQVLADVDLIVPHPEMHRRAFVLAPLADLDPRLAHPVSGLTVQELLARIGPTASSLRLYCREW